MSSQISNFDKLPTEMLVNIFRYFNANELRAFCRVSKQFERAAKAKELWIKIFPEIPDLLLQNLSHHNFILSEKGIENCCAHFLKDMTIGQKGQLVINFAHYPVAKIIIQFAYGTDFLKTELSKKINSTVIVKKIPPLEINNNSDKRATIRSLIKKDLPSADWQIKTVGISYDEISDDGLPCWIPDTAYTTIKKIQSILNNHVRKLDLLSQHIV